MELLDESRPTWPRWVSLVHSALHMEVHMSCRSWIISAAFSVSFAIPAFVALPAACGQEAVQVQPAVDNSKFQFEGVVNSANVFVRSGPNEGYYPTLKLDNGTHVVVVGIKNDWLKILPPKGSFCYVSRLYVDRRSDGSVGRVSKPDVNVRAGSTLNAMKTTVLTKLDIGTDVTIVGEQDEYLKIEPPPGTYLYVNKQFVDPVRAIAAAPGAGGATPVPTAPPDAPNTATGQDTTTPPAAVAQTTPPAGVTPAPTGAAPTPDAGAPAVATGSGVATTTPPAAATSGGTTSDQVATGTATPPNPATQPTDAVATATPTTPAPAVDATSSTRPTQAVAIRDPEAEFHSLETEFTTISQKPLADQPAADLLSRYEALAKTTGIAPEVKHMADFRAATLKVRVDAQQRLADVQRMEAESASRTQALKAEKEELENRLNVNRVTVYSAVGTVQPSSLQFNVGETLYRLTDPGTGRTVAYIKDNDKIASLTGQFVGVRGTATTDSRLALKIIPVTEITPVDINAVNHSIAAGIIPPTLLPRASDQASTGNQ
jgi:uncharacterized protein YgiM (DUF1202 family)